MKWKVGDKLILGKRDKDGNGWGPYETEILEIREYGTAHIRYKTPQEKMEEDEEYYIKHLIDYGTPITKLHKILA